MTEPTEPRSKPSDITRLLYKAVEALPEEEQAAVFEYFFELGIGFQRPIVSPFHPLGSELFVRGTPETRGVKLSGSPGEQKGGDVQAAGYPRALVQETHRRLSSGAPSTTSTCRSSCAG